MVSLFLHFAKEKCDSLQKNRKNGMEAKYYRCTMIATKSKIYVAKVQRKCNVKFALQKEICGDII